MGMTDLKALARNGSIEKMDFPGFKTPMLATLTKEYFDDPEWIYERKLDGMRCLIFKQKGKIELRSRNGKSLNPAFPVLMEHIADLASPDFVADGEIVAFDGKTTSFRKLQKRMQVKDPEKARKIGIKSYLYIFDLLWFGGYGLHDLALVQRKGLLRDEFEWKRPVPVRYTPHRRENGLKYYREACKKGWEGIIAKNGSSPYRHTRSGDWLKFKCTNGQELVIAGFTEPHGKRIGFGALLVGFYKDGKLKYAGKVGTGFSDGFLRDWHKKFDNIERTDSPFSDYNDDDNGQNHWIDPTYVGQFEFTEWTDTDKLRHPSFLGIREDKNPREIVKEV